jgi:hypothetical protein
LQRAVPRRVNKQARITSGNGIFLILNILSAIGFDIEVFSQPLKLFFAILISLKIIAFTVSTSLPIFDNPALKCRDSAVSRQLFAPKLIVSSRRLFTDGCYIQAITCFGAPLEHGLLLPSASIIILQGCE